MSTTAHLEAAGARVFTIYPIPLALAASTQPEVAEWTMPGLTEQQVDALLVLAPGQSCRSVSSRCSSDGATPLEHSLQQQVSVARPATRDWREICTQTSA